MHKIFLMVAIMSFWASAAAAQTTSCTTDNECPGDQICENNLCADPFQSEHLPSPVSPYVPGCAMDQDCKGDRICENGECVNPPTPAPAPAAQVITAYPQPVPQPAPPREYNGPFVLARKGLEFEIRLGATICVPDGRSKCNDFSYQELGDAFTDRKPGPGGGIFFGVRFLPFLAGGIDWGYYFLILETDGDRVDDVGTKFSRFMNIMAAVRGYLPFEPADLYLKLGAGWLSFKEIAKIYDDRVSYRLSAPVNFKIGMGATFFLMDGKERKNVGLGFDFDFLFTEPSTAEECEYKNQCEENDALSEGVFNVFQASVHLTVVIPVFN